MRLIKADHDRWIEIPGLPGPTRRPVDIDRAQTGFTNLRSLRIYQFDADSEINGHAEEDEVFVIVLAGAVEFTASDDCSGASSRTFHLAAAQNLKGDPCVAYLPPQSAYRLIAKTNADVAYARATPASDEPSTVFTSRTSVDAAGITVLLEEKTHAQRLRLRLFNVDTSRSDASFTPIQESEAAYEAMIHVRAIPAEGGVTITTSGSERVQLDSWDTVAIVPGERPKLHFAHGLSALLLTVLAI